MSGRRSNTELTTLGEPEDEPARADPGADGMMPRLFVVSEALPLHVLGLVPPPEGLGAHLWRAAPLEVAVAAAVATAAEMAIPPPAPPPPPRGEPTATAVTSGDAQMPSMTAAATFAARVPKPAEALATLDLSRRAAFNADMAALPEPAAATVDDVVDTVAAPRPRAVGMPRSVLPPPDVALPSVRTLAVVPPVVVRAGSSWPQDEPDERRRDLSTAWPGFATGFVVALAVGAGVYLTLGGG